MKTAIALESFIFFESIYLWRPFNFECLILEMYNKDGVLHFGFTVIFKKWAKEKKKAPF